MSLSTLSRANCGHFGVDVQTTHQGFLFPKFSTACENRERCTRRRRVRSERLAAFGEPFEDIERDIFRRTVIEPSGDVNAVKVDNTYAGHVYLANRGGRTWGASVRSDLFMRVGIGEIPNSDLVRVEDVLGTFISQNEAIQVVLDCYDISDQQSDQRSRYADSWHPRELQS